MQFESCNIMKVSNLVKIHNHAFRSIMHFNVPTLHILNYFKWRCTHILYQSVHFLGGDDKNTLRIGATHYCKSFLRFIQKD